METKSGDRDASPARGPSNGNGKIRPYWPVAAVAAIGLAASWLGFDGISRNETARVRSVLELRADWRTADLQRKILEAPNIVTNAAAFVSTRSAPSPGEFREFLQKQRSSDDAARVVLWAPLVKYADRAAFEAAASRLHGGPVSIVHPDAGQGAQVRWIGAPEQETYAPILLFIDFIGRTAAIPGIDVFYEPTRRAMAMRAAREARILATPPVALTAATADGPGFNVFVPVFPAGSAPATPEERSERLSGFVVGTFAIKRVLDKAIAGTPVVAGMIGVYLSTNGDAGASRQVAFYDPAAWRFRFDTAGAPPPEAALNRVIRSFDAFGQRWTLVYDYPDSMVADLRSVSPWLWLVIGMLLTGLTAAYLLAKQRQVSVVEAAVRRRTRELADVNAALRREGELRAEGDRKLDAAQAINQRIFETSVDLILVVDRKGTFIQVSPSSLAILGYRPEEMEGRNGIEFLFAGDLDATRNEMREGRRSGAPRNFQCRYLHKDGRVVTLAWTGVWSEPEQQHFFIGRDMTLRQAMEQQLRQSQKLEAVGQLTGGIAHDFNNLLGVIIGNLDLAMDPSDPKRQESPHLKSALDAAMRGAELVRRLMVFSRRQPLSPSVFAVNDAIAEFEPLLRRALGEATELQTQFGEAAGRIAADKHQLENALMNLCVNARDAMPSGGIIRVETAPVAVDAASAPLYPDIAPGNYVTISVTDNGTGIAPEHLPKVFEPFFTTKTEGKGTGLGLAMVYGFMRESNGMAKIYSELGHGTTVRLYFPKTEAELSAEDGDAAATVLPTGNETVLVVEDRVDMRAIAVAVLERLGYRALEADTAAAALAVLNSGAKIDLVFSDIVMPGGMSGLDLAQEIRNRGVKTPILLTSGYASPQVLREQAQKLGIPVLGKPYRVADLAAKVRGMLDGRNGNGNDHNGGNGRNGKG